VAAFIARRVGRGLLTLWIVVTAVFFGLRLTGDPVVLLLGSDAPTEAYDRMRAKLGLDAPAPVQYVRYLGLAAAGDFGDSLRERRPAAAVVLERLPATLELAAAALLLAICLGVPAGVLAALHRNGPLDRALMAVAFVGQSVPAFFLGIVLILAFSLWLRLLPSGGRGSWQQLLMPALTLSTYGIASLARLTRSAVLEVLHQDYVRSARAKGLRERRVLFAHVLRNATIPVVTVLGLQVGQAISGAVVTETVFAWPGMGRLIAGAVFSRDYPVIQFAVLLIAASVVAVNVVVDLLYGVLDPRVRR
jgi:peptide/nickel transport system permease protein